MSTRRDHPSQSARVGGSVSGQVVVGSNNSVSWRQGAVADGVTPADLDELRGALAELRALVLADGGANAQGADRKVDELEEALGEQRPDLATIEHVQGWFTRHVPRLSGAVGRLILSPLVTRIVAAAGDDLAAEFSRRFGG